MYNPNEKVKLNVSKAIKDLNKQYHRNYTMQDLANEIGVSREALSRLTSYSAFNLIYAVASCLYEFYSLDSGAEWNLVHYIEIMAWDDNSFIL